ncbi:hypothetical protein ACFLWF_00135 [Chloroflexota bacterium]
MEKKGVPTLTICSDTFEMLAKTTAESISMAKLPIVVIKHPLGGLSSDKVIEKAEGVFPDVLDKLTGR